MIVAAGWLLVITRSTGRTVSSLGARPKLHIKTAPLQTCCGMGLFLSIHCRSSTASSGTLRPFQARRCAFGHFRFLFALGHDELVRAASSLSNTIANSA